MGRLILILAALFLAPTLLWFGWRWLNRRKPESEATAVEPERWQDAPWMWLVLGGLVLSVIAVLAFGILEQRDCRPVPTQVIDGKLVPAHCE